MFANIMNPIVALLFVGLAPSVWSFHVPTVKSSSSSTALLAEVATPTATFAPYKGEALAKAFPGAMDNVGLENKVCDILSGKGFTPDNTLLATSLCCDELARRLEDDFVRIYGNNFNLGGLSGFPFAGNTGFGAMAAHIPDGGYCLIVYGPHVGITKQGQVGKVERVGIKLVDTCCGSAIAASNYLKGITDGGATIKVRLQEFTDFQQGAVQELILPHGKRLSDAKDRMVELPYALYASQDLLMMEIATKGAKGAKNKNGIALLGGVQINTAPDTSDYFVPLRFDLLDNKGAIVESMLEKLTGVPAAAAAAAPAAAEAKVEEEEPKGFWKRLFGGN